MQKNGKLVFEEIIKEGLEFKREIWNCDDPSFDVWHEKAKQAVVQYIPIKLSAFNEIAFASDYFLSKPDYERAEINDRIALVDDFNLVEKLFDFAIETLEKEVRRQRFLKFKKNKSEKLNTDLPSLATVKRFPELLEQAESMRFSNREVGEIKSELERLELEFSQPVPSWDRVKRIVKFFLDYDGEFALLSLPIILEEYKKASV
jgi:hypothetical protein